MPRIPEGKVPWERIAKAVQGRLPPEVVLGPAHGEDAALVKLGGELWAVAADPISFSESGAGRLAVLVNANDVVVRGATPQIFLAVVLLSAEQAPPRVSCRPQVSAMMLSITLPSLDSSSVPVVK